MEIGNDQYCVQREVTPRNYVLYRGIQLDPDQLDRMRKSAANENRSESGWFPGINLIRYEDGSLSQVPPPFPEWFDEQCRHQLMNPQSSTENSGGEEKSGSQFSSEGAVKEYDTGIGRLTCHTTDAAQRHESMKLLLKAQLEYYFSRENLAQDRYLKCQMDTDGFVAISTIAGFRKVVALTDNYDLIVQTLRESRKVEVDDAGERVRPISQRCTIILREMGETTEEEIKELLAGGPAYKSLRTYGTNDEWYVVYSNEETTKTAYLHIQQLKPSICARIKSGPPPDQQLYVQAATPSADDVLSSIGGGDDGAVYELGKLLMSYGYTPQTTFKPGATVVQVLETNASPSPSPVPSLSSIALPDYPSLLNGHPLVNYNSGLVVGGVVGGGGVPLGVPLGVPGGMGGGAGYRRGSTSSHHSTTQRGGGTAVGNGSVPSGRPQRGGGVPVTPPRASAGSRGASNGGSLTVMTKPIRGGDKRWSTRNGHQAPSSTAGFGPEPTSLSPPSFNASWGSTSSASREGAGGSGSTSTMNESVHTAPSPASAAENFAFEDQAFPSLTEPKPEPEPVKPKLSFSSVAAGRKEDRKEPPKKSFAACLKQ